MARSQTVLIVGCGYLGVEVGCRLIERGWHVRGTARGAERFDHLAARGIEGVELDLARAGETRAWDERYDAVVYSVAPGRDGDPRLGFHDGALAALEHASCGRPFVYVSSAGVYSRRDGGEVDETSLAEPSEGRHWWIRRAEKVVLSRARPGVVVRLGGLYGPGRSPLDWVRRRDFRERLAARAGNAFMNWIRVEDAAEGVALAVLRAPAGAVFDLVDGTPVRRREFFGLAAQLAEVAPIPFREDPADLGKRCRGARAREELEFTPRYPSYREGLAALVDRGRRHGRRR